MLKTLHGYVLRDLLKILLLALIVLTLVMSLVGIVEPLRKRGLEAAQAVQIFGLLVPIMVSLTLPIAALFAATMVYGRLSHDNELLACRASGVSTLTVLRPGLVIGLMVAVGSVGLSNFVSPALARFLEKKIEGDVKGIVAHEIRTQGHFEQSSMPYILHARQAEVLDDGRLKLLGMVGIDISDPDDLSVLAAETAVVDFRRVNNRTYAGITMTNFSALDSLSGRIQHIKQGRSEELPPLPSLVREKPALYDWHRLLAVLDNPVLHGEIQQKLGDLYREIRHSQALEAIRQTIESGQIYRELEKLIYPPDQVQQALVAARFTVERAKEQGLESGQIYDELDKRFGQDPGSRFYDQKVSTIIWQAIREARSEGVDPGRFPEELAKRFRDQPVQNQSYRLSAGMARWTRQGRLELLATDPTRRVVLRVLQEGRPPLIYTANRALLQAEWRALAEQSYLTITLQGNVAVRTGHRGIDHSRESRTIGAIPLPEVSDQASAQPSPERLTAVLKNPEQFTSDPRVIRQIEELRNHRVPKLWRETLGEVHGRLAYGVGCFLMVAFGAALGIIFRGGQVISAFALSMIPAATLIIIVIMGKQLLSQDIEAWQGVAVIWSGVVLLAAANLVAYWRLARRC